MKSRQFCSVCKQWLDMEIVPTGDGDDDGVVWFRCPQCQGFLPKLSVMSAEPGGDASASGDASGIDDASALEASALALEAADAAIDEEFGTYVPDPSLPPIDADDDEDDEDDADDEAPRPVGVAAPLAGAEPVMEYAAMLAAVDPETSVPYRPWDSYEVGQCVLHLAWNDCGVVVAKEVLPGGRRVIKCWFQGAGVVRLIENAPR
jgi:hypothetical protein